MSLPVGQTSYRTYSVSSDSSTLRTIPVSSPTSSVSSVPYNLNGSYESVRYLVPVHQAMQQQQQQQFVMMPQVMPQVMSAQMMPQMMTPVYMQNMQNMQNVQQLQNVQHLQTMQTLPRISVSSQESSDLTYQLNSSDLMYQQNSIRETMNGSPSPRTSQMSSPVKTPEVFAAEEVQLVDDLDEDDVRSLEEVVEIDETVIISSVSENRPLECTVERTVERPAQRSVLRSLRTEQRSDYPQVIKMDTRFFGELLAEVYRKNCDIHSCIAEHVAKIRGRKHQLDSTDDYKVDREEVEALIPKGASELTKQQIRYLLQTRLTADKSMRLLLSTFSSLREELLHMSDDLRRLESEKESLERDLSFKADQAQQYDRLLENVRENNRQLQVSLQDASSSQRSLETQLMSSKTVDSGRDFKMKELEGRLRTMEQENDMLRQKLAGQGSSSSASMQLKTDELSRQYKEQLDALKQEKEKEMRSLQSQLTRIQTEVTTTTSSSDRSLQLKISELTSMLEQRQRTITHLEEEIRKMRMQFSNTSKNVTSTIVTKRYMNQYPILGLLSDEYLLTSPIKEAKDIALERRGGLIK